MRWVWSFTSALALTFVIPQKALCDDVLYAFHLLAQSQEIPLNQAEFIRLQNSLLNIGLPSLTKNSATPTSSRIKFDVAPVLKHDDNINGGNPTGPLRVSSVTLQLDEALQKKSDLGAGSRFMFTAQKGLAIGHSLNFLATHAELRGVKHRNQVSQSSIVGCSEKLFPAWWHVSTCLSNNISEKRLSEAEDIDFSFSIGKAVRMKNNRSLKISTSLSSTRTTNFQQHAVAVKTHVLLNNYNELNLGMKAFSDVDEFLTRTSQTSLGAKFRPWNKSVEVNFVQTTSAGPNFFGLSRKSVSEVIQMSFKPHESLVLTIGLKSNNDSIDFFDSNDPILELQFAPIKF